MAPCTDPCPEPEAPPAPGRALFPRHPSLAQKCCGATALLVAGKVPWLGLLLCLICLPPQWPLPSSQEAPGAAGRWIPRVIPPWCLRCLKSPGPGVHYCGLYTGACQHPAVLFIWPCGLVCLLAKPYVVTGSHSSTGVKNQAHPEPGFVLSRGLGPGITVLQSVHSGTSVKLKASSQDSVTCRERPAQRSMCNWGLWVGKAPEL